MNIENDIPMCYAVMEIKEKLDADLGDISIYVAAGCYVLKQTAEYLGNGEIELSGDVVFMWDKNGSRITPQFDSNNRCINKIAIDTLYLSAEEAINKAEDMNRKGLVTKIMNLPMDKMTIVRSKAPEMVNRFRTMSAEFLKNDQNIIDRNLASNINILQKLKKA